MCPSESASESRGWQRAVTPVTGWDKIRIDVGVLSECCPGGPLDFIDQDDTLRWGRRLLLETLRQREADLTADPMANLAALERQLVRLGKLIDAAPFKPSWALLCNCHLCQKYKRDDGSQAVRLYLGADSTVDDIRPPLLFPSRESAVAAQLGDPHRAEYLVVPYPETKP